MQHLEGVISNDDRGRGLVKSILTGKIYKIRTTRDWIAILESLDGSSQVLTEKSILNLFYEKVENFMAPSGS